MQVESLYRLVSWASAISFVADFPLARNKLSGSFSNRGFYSATLVKCQCSFIEVSLARCPRFSSPGSGMSPGIPIPGSGPSTLRRPAL